MKRMCSDADLEKILKEQGPLTVVNYDRDPDIEGAIVGQRELLIEATTLNDDQKREINELTNAVLVKIGALRHHANAFAAFEDQRFHELLGDEQTLRLIQLGVIFSERELTYEFDAYMHQFKSSLDMLAKIIGLVLYNNPKIPQTYSDAGKGVVTFIEKYTKNLERRGEIDKVFKNRLDRVVEMISLARDPWIKPVPERVLPSQS
jgi:hypothetical protein